MKKLLMVTMLLLVSMMALVSSSNYGYVSQGDCVDLVQTCVTCDAVNIDNVKLPNNTIILTNSTMTKSGITYSYNWCQTQELGEYQYSTYSGNVTSVVKFWVNNVGREITIGEVSISLFSSISTLLILGLFLWFAVVVINKEVQGQEQHGIKWFLIGMCGVLLILHVWITQGVIDSLIGGGYLSNAYSLMLKMISYLVAPIVGLIIARFVIKATQAIKESQGLR